MTHEQIKIYEELKAGCFCTLYEDIPIGNKLHTGSSGYFQKDGLFIVITTDNETYEEKYTTLLHEMKHASCWFRNCTCQNQPDNYLKELHAYTAELEGSFFDMNVLSHAIYDIEYIANNTKDLERYEGHHKACKNLMKTKLWRRAKKT